MFIVANWTGNISSSDRLPDPLDRLKEMNYWYGKMSAHSNEDVFDYYLRAFVQAGVSVLETLRTGYCNRKQPKLDEWYKREYSSRVEDCFFRFFEERRNRAFHTGTKPTLNAIFENFYVDPATGEVEDTWESAVRFFSDDKPVFPLSGRFMVGLRELLIEFGKFSGEWDATQVPTLGQAER